MKLIKTFFLGFGFILGLGSFALCEKFHFEYYVTIKPSQNKEISVWVPYPAQNQYQKIHAFKVTSPWAYKLKQEKKYGNRVIYLTGKSHSKPVKLKFSYEIERLPDTGLQSNKNSPYLQPELYLKPNKLVPQNPTIRKIAHEESKSFQKPLKKARAFYNYVVKNLSYDKTGNDWGRGDAVWACDVKKGNCTDFHSLFIAMNRDVKIPARFEIGVPIPADKTSGEISGYHCWARIYIKGKGWIPIDSTEAKKTGKMEEYFGKLPSNRIQFTHGRDLILNPPQKGEPLNYFIYPYVEVEGKPYTEVQKKFFFKKLG